ncbi:MAG: hypothetical protein AB7P48_15185, partial [Methylocystis sp.]
HRHGFQFIAETPSKNLIGVYQGSTRTRHHSTRSQLSLMETNLVFLAKCAICILLVLIALQWRADDAPNMQKSAAARSAAQKKAGLAGDVAAGAASLVRDGGDALANAARDKCLAAPRDCLLAAQRLQSAAGRAR